MQKRKQRFMVHSSWFKVKHDGEIQSSWAWFIVHGEATLVSNSDDLFEDTAQQLIVLTMNY